MGEKSLLNWLLWILSFPSQVKNWPFLAFRVGMTQSNRSIPFNTALIISSGFPTPMRYLSLSLGKISFINTTVSNIASFSSPTASPPMAIPVWAKGRTVSALCFLSSSSTPPCTMGKNEGQTLQILHFPAGIYSNDQPTFPFS